jgi:hypothetical protein
VTGYRSQPDGDPVEEVECLRPVPFDRHKSGRRRFKPPKLDITLPGLPSEVLTAFAEIQAAARPRRHAKQRRRPSASGPPTTATGHPAESEPRRRSCPPKTPGRSSSSSPPSSPS